MDKEGDPNFNYIGIEPRFHEFRVPVSAASVPPALAEAFLPLSSIAHYCESARTRLIGRTFSKSDHGLGALQHAYTPGQGFVLKSQNISIIGTQNVTGQHFKVRTSLVKIGTSSISLEHELIGVKTGHTIAKNSITMILINFTQKKTAPLPSKVKDLLSPLLQTQTVIPIHPIPEKGQPVQIFSRKFMVLLSDLDMLGHTNHGSYLKWAEDTKWLAAREEGGFKSSLLRALCTCRIEAIDTVYISETFFSQHLECSIWPLYLNNSDLGLVPNPDKDKPIAFGVQLSPVEDPTRVLWHGIYSVLPLPPAKL